MISSPLLSNPAALPRPGDPEKAVVGLDRWREAADSCRDADAAEFARRFAEDGAGRALLEAVFGNSPFLSQCLLVDLPFAARLLRRGPEAVLRDLLVHVAAVAEAGLKADDAAGVIRTAKRRAALAIALADIADLWGLETVTDALTSLAGTALRSFSRMLLREAAADGAFAIGDSLRPEDEIGLVVLGMGKLGARELNYSSDIDLIVLFDRERIRTDDPHGLQRHFTRLARRLAKLMGERGPDGGYVFRTDLRLRPDPGATPPAVSTEAAETYYESTGQNWERAAFIKARFVAGHREAGKEFLRRLRPFIWRKHLDFAAIQDIHSIKRQIAAQRGGSVIRVEGHNVKLGRGGIREIEFFAQTQQLIWGGRQPELRLSATCEALGALVAAGHVEEATAARMAAAYRFLRRLEHRLQMVADQQTQTLPADEAGIAHIAAFLGYREPEDFRRELLSHLRAVEEHYAALFEESPALGGPGNLVFTGSEHDPETLETLRRMGFDDPAAVSSMIRAWHHGRYRATRSQRARELLTEMTPALLEAFGKTAHPNAAFARFDDFLSGLPAGVQLFSLFHANPGLFRLLSDIMGGAPRLAEVLSRRPLLFDAVLSAEFFDAPPAREALSAELAAVLVQAQDFQDVLDLIRRWSADQQFRVGVQMLRGDLPVDEAGAALADVADASLAALFPPVEADLAQRHGRVPGGGMIVVALGKLGGRELTVTSDLDLMFVYDAAEGAEASDGERPLGPSHYFTRLSQRYLNAVTAHTAEGRLYEVDMRLRPSGNAGPIATGLEAFLKYHRESAWTWERMALTRARVVAGPEDLARRFEAEARAVLTARRDPQALLRDAAAMRARMLRERQAASPWDVKDLRGGLVDIEFIAQYLQLRHAPEHPGVLAPNTGEALRRLAAAGALDSRAADELVAGLRLWQQVQGMLRLTAGAGFDEEAAPAGLKRALARYAGCDSFASLRRLVLETAERCHARFVALIEEPAAALAPPDGAQEERREGE